MVWESPPDLIRVATIDTHTEGEPTRFILNGYPEIRGKTILEMRRNLQEHQDFLRKALMWEPRGHADMYGCLITPPVSEGADFGVIFMHNEGYSTMCGHAIIAVTKLVLETGVIPPVEPVTTLRIDSPAGLITSYAKVIGGTVDRIYFHNVPSFALALDQKINVPGLGEVKYDLAFGGAFYAFVDAKSIGLDTSDAAVSKIIEAGRAIKLAVTSEPQNIIHPVESDLNFLYGTIFVDQPKNPDADFRHVCVFADGEVDRSPTGTGVSALMAILHARGQIGINEPRVVESITGGRFTGRVVQTLDYNQSPAVIPEIEGTAFITGRHEFLINLKDPLKHGFILR